MGEGMEAAEQCTLLSVTAVPRLQRGRHGFQGGSVSFRKSRGSEEGGYLRSASISILCGNMGFN